MTTPNIELARSLSARLCKVESEGATSKVNPHSTSPQAMCALAVLQAGLLAASLDDLEMKRCADSGNSSGYTSSQDESSASTCLQSTPCVMTTSSQVDDDTESIDSTCFADLNFGSDTLQPKSAVPRQIPAPPLGHEPFQTRSTATKDVSHTEPFSPSPWRPVCSAVVMIDTEPSHPLAPAEVTDSATAQPPMAAATIQGMSAGVAKMPMTGCQLSREDSPAPELTANYEGSKLHQLDTEPNITSPVHKRKFAQGAEGWFAELRNRKDPIPAVINPTPPGDPSEVPSNVEELQGALRRERETVGDLQRRVDEAEAISRLLQGEIDLYHMTQSLAGVSKMDRQTAVEETLTTKFRRQHAEPASFQQVLATQVEKLQCKTFANEHQIRWLMNVVHHQTREIERLKSTAVTQHLEEEVIQLRAEGVRMRQDLVVARENEKALKKQISCLPMYDFDAHVETGRTVPDSSGMEHLSTTMKEQLDAVELELKKMMRERTQLVEPFLMKMHDLLVIAMHAADKLERRTGSLPGKVALFHPSKCKEDLAKSLVSIVEGLQYSVDCMERFTQ